MTIKNEKSIKEEQVEELRGHLEHRATWFYFLVEEACNHGLEMEDFARTAIGKVGEFHGDNKLVDTDSLEEFAENFLPENVRKIFEMDVEIKENQLIVDFHYCPLVAAWMKHTDDEDKIDVMCDIAMEGDRGIISTYDKFNYDLQKTIASGDEFCRLVITKRE